MTLDYAQALRMAELFKARGDEVKEAIEECQGVNYGVVALKFSNGCREMEIEILNEPYEPDVRVYPG